MPGDKNAIQVASERGNEVVELQMDSSVLADLEAGLPVHIPGLLEQIPEEEKVDIYITPNCDSQNPAEQNEEDDYDMEDCQETCCQNQHKRRWNGCVRTAYEDNNWQASMLQIKEFKASGKMPVFDIHKKQDKFRSKAKSYELKGDKLLMSELDKQKGTELQVEVVINKKEQCERMKCIHSGAGKSVQSRALGGHLGINTLRDHLRA